MSDNDEEEQERREMERVLYDKPKRAVRKAAAAGSPAALNQTSVLIQFMAQQAQFTKDAQERAERFQTEQTKVMGKMFLAVAVKKNST